MKFKFSALALALSAATGAQAALTAGDIAIIGRINNGSPDSFSFVALSNISAGEVIYFTDNGWTGSGYRGSTATDGDGNENLLKWTAASAISAGSIINTASSAGFTTSGSIPGTTSGSFASLALSQTGDQITAFQNSNSSNPLFNTATQTSLFQLDDTNGFENATDAQTGNVAPGLTSGTTALTFNFTSATTIAINASVLSGAAKTKAQWLAVFSNAANWTTTGTTLPTGSIAVTTAVPEPTSGAIALAGLGVAGLLARRRRAI